MTPIFDLMVNDKLVDDIFSICLAEHGGVITLGDYDSQTMKSQITWVPMVTSYPPTFYTVSLPGYMRIGKRDVNLPKFNTAIVDSGTTLLVVSTNTFLGIAKHLKTHHCDVPGLCGKNSWFQPAVCVTINDAGLALMPKLSFLVGPDKEVLELLPEHYMLPFEVSKHALIFPPLAIIELAETQSPRSNTAGHWKEVQMCGNHDIGWDFRG
mmetsp:Transcript_6204/g.26196  ORF Transcript_6204/g.26196 Transcript_6204/m.26196 type:complete len:210 (+) Transcript_6204:850-1479(+)